MRMRTAISTGSAPSRMFRENWPGFLSSPFTALTGVTGWTGAPGWAALRAVHTAEGRWTDWALSGPWVWAARLA